MGLALVTNMPAAAAERVTRISGDFFLGDAPTLIAERRGHFADHGLSAEVEFRAAGMHNLERLRADETDFALMALTPLAIDLVNDTTPGEADDPVILASLAHVSRPHAIVAPASGPIARFSDLDGRKLGLARGSGGEFAWWLAQRYRDNLEDVEVVDRAPDALAAALADGQVDAALMWTPWRERFENETQTKLRALAGIGYTAKWVLVTRRAVCRQEPERCRAVLSAYRDAISAIRQHPQRAKRTYAEHVGVPPPRLDEVWNPMLYALNLDWSLISELQQRLEWVRHTRNADHAPSPLRLLAPAPLRALEPSVVSVPKLADEQAP